MSWNDVRLINSILQIAIILFIVIRSINCVGKSERSMLAVFFLASMVTILLNNLYWLAYQFIYQDVRMPFCVADFSENNAFLLLASSLISVFPDHKKRPIAAGAAAWLFVAANIALWIVWSGEWLKDIVGGLCFGYYAYHVLRALVLSKAFTRAEWTAWGIMGALFIGVQGAGIFAPESMTAVLDGLTYVLLFGSMLGFLIRLFLDMRRDAEHSARISRAFAGYFWAACAIYSSAEPYWFAAEFFSMLMLLFMQFSVERQVSAA